MRPALVVSLALALAPLTAQADVYRWVDATGEEHYSDRPVEGAELIRMTTPRPATPRSAPPPRTAAVASPGEAPPTSDTARAVAKDLAAQRARECSEAKARYEKSLQARRIFRTLENGEREYLSDAEADQVRLDNRARMDAACGKATASR